MPAASVRAVDPLAHVVRYRCRDDTLKLSSEPVFTTTTDLFHDIPWWGALVIKGHRNLPIPSVKPQ